MAEVGNNRSVTVLMAVVLQIASVLVLAFGAALVSDLTSAGYAVLGGAAAIIPNGLFALRLATHRGRSAESYPVVFFLGQLTKIALTVALLAAISKWLGPVRWLPLLLGLIVALQAPLFALLYVSKDAGGSDKAAGGTGSGSTERPVVSAD